MATRRREARSRTASGEAGRDRRPEAPDVLNVEVTLAPRPDGLAVVHSAERPALDNVSRYRVTSAQALPASNALAELGFEVTAVGAASISAKVSADTYRRLFSTQLEVFRQPVGALIYFSLYRCEARRRGIALSPPPTSPAVRREKPGLRLRRS